MKKLILITTIAIFAIGCNGLTIKVQKKDKGSNLSGADAANSGLNSGEIESAEDFLEELDSLKSVAFDLLIKQLKGEDFQTAARNSIRDFRTHLVSEASKEHTAKMLDIDMSDLTCESGRLNLNHSKLQKHLGLILRAAVLAKLSSSSSKVLNNKLAGDAQAIAQLILNEIGLKVEGDSDVSKVGESTRTAGSVVISLLPFAAESAELQERDSKESLEMNYERILNSDKTGSFKAVLAASVMEPSGDTSTYEAEFHVARTKEDGHTVHSSVVMLSKNDQPAHYIRRLKFEEVQSKVIRVVDYGKAAGVEKENAFVIDLGEIGKCLPSLDDLTQDDSDDREDDLNDIDEAPEPNDPKGGSNEGDNTNQDEDTSGDTKGSAGDTEVPEEDDSPVSDPSQNGGQTPNQN
jgi:hypothetical protein